MRASLCKNVTISFVCTLIISCEQKQPEIPQLSFEEEIQQRLIQAQPGDIIEIPAGTHNFTRSLSLNVPGVTIKGAGIDSSILSFKNQKQGGL